MLVLVFIIIFLLFSFISIAFQVFYLKFTFIFDRTNFAANM